MYDELVKALKQCADASCNGCKNELVQIGCRGKLQREAADAIEELICEVADEHNARLDAEERQRWIPVSERLPEQKINQNTLDFEYVLCVTTFGDVRPYKFGRRIGQGEPHFWNGAGYVDAYVTHWMPLPQPQPPKEGE